MIQVSVETIKTWISAGLQVKVYKNCDGQWMVRVGGPA
jgi:hypothetical protein